MATALVPPAHRPPGLYRLARVFRRIALIVLVVLAIYLATVGYSAYELAQSSPQSGGYSAAFDSNNTVAVTGSFQLTNPGYFPLSGLTVSLRVLNASGDFIGYLVAGPVTIGPQSSTTVPFDFYLPISTSGTAASLLTADQYLDVGFWGNATYAYLFPVALHFDQTKFWGAPFADLSVVAGDPTVQGGEPAVPVTISFENHASFTEDGTLSFEVLEAGGVSCGGSSLAIDVPPQAGFDRTASIGISPTCSPTGDVVQATYVGNGVTIALPPEALP